MHICTSSVWKLTPSCLVLYGFRLMVFLAYVLSPLFLLCLHISFSLHFNRGVFSSSNSTLFVQMGLNIYWAIYNLLETLFFRSQQTLCFFYTKNRYWARYKFVCSFFIFKNDMMLIIIVQCLVSSLSVQFTVNWHQIWLCFSLSVICNTNY